jgi:D-alanine--poly(phosphoribitol) ligase subunit 1
MNTLTAANAGNPAKSPNLDNLAALFYASAHSGPDRDALVWEEGTLSYAAFRDRIESLRPAIAAEPGTFVGILAHRSPLAYAAVQAILAQGRAYAPMNPGFPPARNAYILRKASLGTLVVGEECAAAFGVLLKEVDKPLRVVVMGEAPQVKALAAASPFVTLVEAVLGSGLEPAPLAPVPADGSAYVLFTSGSTGQPKGVRVRHDNVQSYIASFLELYPISREDRLSQTFDITFDVSVHDQFVTWSAGAALVVFPEKALFSPLGYAASRKVTVWFSVPALAAFLESARQVIPGALPDVRLSLFAGEKLTWKTCELWKTIAPNSALANLYGPTETTIVVLHFKIPPGFPEARCHQGGIPIGHTWDRQRMEIRRADGSLCADGEVGGLWLAGDQVAPGYLGEEKMTAERFIERDGAIWYRSGDLVFRDAEGLVQYQGREDFQVKVMGYRIELGEIENELMRVSGAAFAIADVAQVRSGMDEIYCILPAAFAPRKKEIKTGLKEKLPAYMVPRHYYYTDDIPLNSNGKMDRGAIKQKVLAGTM